MADDSYNTLTVSLTFLLGWMISLGLTVRVIMRKRPVGVSLAWLVLVLSVPYIGAFFYLLLGELKLGYKRARRAEQIVPHFTRWLESMAQSREVNHRELPASAKAVERHATVTVGIPTLPGNDIILLDDCLKILDQLVEDINEAQLSIHMEFYIWALGGKGDDVLNALVAAAKRGVSCRVLLDSVGSKNFLRSRQCREARQAGVVMVEALPASIFRMLFRRQDIRLHRKIVVIDRKLGYTGSLNLVDARFFKTKAGVGEWIDTMVRIKGPVVDALDTVFLADWTLETGHTLAELKDSYELWPLPESGLSPAQVVPSGPGYFYHGIYQTLLTTIYSAQRELIITTPYFVPDEAIATALVSAALRGVNVTLVIPEKVDSKLVRYASRSYYDEMLAAGVRIEKFIGGLLHTKSISVDGELGLIGSVNLDQRSFWLNYECSLFVYDPEFVERLRNLQFRYIKNSKQLNAEIWSKRPWRQRFIENTVRLISPLL